MNKAKNLLKEEYLEVLKNWEYWCERSAARDDEGGDILEKFWYDVLKQITLLINNL